ncbi:MAG: hypothetical protein A3H69_00970 [Candidatus Sungbacteria bacterium RIFCSPLOWO2_02_FULL_47_9]|uniref:Inositol-1-monophosphatase n=1 Tax=Candidatus Sungbacteria bacterium RIFCSPHIGHO2_01_FULL_47_32 TaxID=1802264 RepID=A0A1G2K8K5_9BACT|nr:MAG: Inositol-phosphate phosphatase [Parcubacteria group bacterium GW2011_GWA2_47_10]OGZ95762.1 MAG: hypothetical protein A2633_00500 [Candidatus Sungbacteria bacterium RIFCSPHIGHO2_01_FULL_47_32]OGZ99077.1 MAG: hypothetical protein A3D57_03425 [Candidatus Sungbacteria bacterium RIFCSPHIGHO2_02_FULL_46_12]OHA04569.1 MAG: hypothetical protein A3A28_01245 [Candidatus Sungbacteria bacterium RIFCSPLOWO2_01_FULL_47_32]OHA09612.1 MAG: hypothetical protein A3H69_00970 [Candidatus Sungbacteria bacte
MSSPILSTAEKAARAGGEAIRKWFRKDVLIEVKPDTSLVSIVDREAERAVLSVIEKAFPLHSIVSEEAGTFDRNSDYTWYIDPLDGTTNFLHHFPFFCSSVACTTGTEAIAGAIYDPIHDELFSAEKGKGAYLNGKKIVVSGNIFEKSLIVASRGSSVEQKLKGLRIAEEIEPHIHHGTKFTGSAAMNLCYTACGRFDGNIGASLHPHDIAAGILIAKEAGADVLNFTGDPATFLDPDIVVGNRDMTSNMLKYIKRAVRSRRK